MFLRNVGRSQVRKEELRLEIIAVLQSKARNHLLVLLLPI
jgi:hypothetical protein